MRLVIAEKPSVAKSIASALGASSRADAIDFATLGFSAISSLLILFLRFLVLGQIFFFILQVEIIRSAGTFFPCFGFSTRK